MLPLPRGLYLRLIYTSLSQWMSPQPENSPWCCPYCTEELTFYQKFMSAPPLVALEFAGHPIEIDNQISIKIENLEYSYNLVGIVYYGSEHFTARIILEDGQIWFHDGVTTMQTSQYDGSLALNCSELSAWKSGPVQFFGPKFRDWDQDLSAFILELKKTAKNQRPQS